MWNSSKRALISQAHSSDLHQNKPRWVYGWVGFGLPSQSKGHLEGFQLPGIHVANLSDDKTGLRSTSQTTWSLEWPQGPDVPEVEKFRPFNS